MNTKGKAISFLTVLAAVTILLSIMPNRVRSDEREDDQEFSGTFHLIFGGTIPGVISIHRDGTFTSVDGSDFGGPPFPRKNSPVLGAWVRTGDQTSKLKAYS